MRRAFVRCATAIAIATAAGCAYDRPRLADDVEVDALDAPIDVPEVDALDARLVDALDARIDAFVDPADVDGDGILNASDNCRTLPNTNQYNDDGDAFGDVCDPCPHQNDASAPLNADGDDIGDTCGDPDTGAPHCIAWFDGFQSANTLPRYTRLNGSWTIAGSVLVQQTNSVSEAVAKVAGVTFRGPTVFTRVTIDGFGPASPSRSAGVASQLGDAVSGVPDGFIAELNQNNGDNGGYVLVSEVRAGTLRTGSVVHPAGFPTETSFDVVLGPPAAAVRASVTLVAQPITSNLTTSPPPLVDGSAGVRTRRVSASFNYLLVVQAAGSMSCPVRVEP